MTVAGGEGLGALLRRLREQRGWTCQRLAEELSAASQRDTLTRTEVWRYEQEKRLLGPHWLPHYARVLMVNLEELEQARGVSRRHRKEAAEATTNGAAEVVAALLPEPGVFTRSAAMAEGRRRLGGTDVDALLDRVHGLRLADDVVGGADLIGPVTRELDTAVALYQASARAEPVGRRLLTGIGELAQIAGWVTSDAGAHREAERIYQLGIAAAREADDAASTANLISCLAYQEANSGSPARAVLLARAAVETAEPHAPPRAVALLHDRLAWAHAQAGDAQAALRALEVADDAMASYDWTPDPAWLYWVTQDELDVMAARVYTELRRPLKAVSLLSTALGRYDASHAREVSLYCSWLAVAYADANEPEEAAAVASRMLTLGTVGSARAADRLTAVAAALSRFRTVPEVAAVLDAIAG